VRLDQFKKLYMEKTARRDYEVGGKVWHVRALCYCRFKVLNEPWEVVASKDAVMIGQLVHMGVEKVTGYKAEVYRKEVGEYVVYGTPDLYDGELVEVKFTAYAPKEPRDHDVLQLKLYLWLLDEERGYLWYLSPWESKEFEIEASLTDEDVVRLIEYPLIPMWPEWECKRCSLYPCKYVLGGGLGD